MLSFYWLLAVLIFRPRLWRAGRERRGLGFAGTSTIEAAVVRARASLRQRGAGATPCAGRGAFGLGATSVGLLDPLTRHELEAQLHLLRYLVNVLGFRATFGATYDLVQLKHFRLVVFPNPDVCGFRHFSFYLQANKRAHVCGNVCRDERAWALRITRAPGKILFDHLINILPVRVVKKREILTARAVRTDHRTDQRVFEVRVTIAIES